MNLLGDGVCDDSLNKEITNYDNGDCCDETASKAVCEVCLCSSERLTPVGTSQEEQSQF